MATTEPTVLRAIYPRARGGVTLRGDGAGLDWFTSRAPDAIDGDTSIFKLDVQPTDAVQVKLVRDDGKWMVGRNPVIGHRDQLVLRPSFDRTTGELSGLRTVDLPWGGAIHIRVFVPPSYAEQELHRYPVLYCQDGQSVWSDGTDPFGVWHLDRVLDDLWDMGALDEIIVVSIDTGVGRLDRLAPVPDPHHGGGQDSAHHLRAMVEVLKPLIDREYRTRSEREATVMLGSSMGGLFSFWAAWQHPEVFGGAICLSPSFWWGERFALDLVQKVCPSPQPVLYLDCGNAASGFEADASTRDGNHNTRALFRALRDHCYAATDDLTLLNWPGHHHDSASWAARVATPLQMFFPRAD
jgi:predicted alpha/beta superfamily hydrolase|nr:alpha/beta hydrolase-fold protein [Kofleriaceae bacterium]